LIVRQLVWIPAVTGYLMRQFQWSLFDAKMSYRGYTVYPYGPKWLYVVSLSLSQS
jgi:uncharacterized membrane protein